MYIAIYTTSYECSCCDIRCTICAVYDMYAQGAGAGHLRCVGDIRARLLLLDASCHGPLSLANTRARSLCAVPWCILSRSCLARSGSLSLALCCSMMHRVTVLYRALSLSLSLPPSLSLSLCLARSLSLSSLPPSRFLSRSVARSLPPSLQLSLR
jgi:hypothetical protein